MTKTDLRLVREIGIAFARKSLAKLLSFFCGTVHILVAHLGRKAGVIEMSAQRPR